MEYLSCVEELFCCKQVEVRGVGGTIRVKKQEMHVNDCMCRFNVVGTKIGIEIA